jgi:hypothetical protein
MIEPLALTDRDEGETRTRVMRIRESASRRCRPDSHSNVDSRAESQIAATAGLTIRRSIEIA